MYNFHTKVMVGILLIVTSALASAQETFSTEHMQTHTGFISFHYDQSQDKIFLEVSEFNQPFILQTSLPRGVGSNDIGLDRGQLGSTRLVQFERFGNKVMLRQLNTQYRAQSDNAAEINSINEAFASSIIAGFKVVKDTDAATIIDYTEFLLSDIHGVSKRMEATNQGSFSLQAARSGIYLERTKAFAQNTELEAMLTFSGSKPGEYVQQVTPDPESVTVHSHHSLVALPDDGYQPRQFHPYSGFWKFSYFDYSTPITEPMEQKYIYRHRLKKQDPSAETSEAVEPIIYYLDPGIPEPVMSALKDGALWWNQAFEAIGYKDAFQVKVLPEGADPMDVRYNVINWVHRATRGWSYGMSVRDPRTGEIIKGQVTLGSLRVRQDYLIALGLTSPFTSADADTSEQQAMALARIRQLSAHEVGHTLGIAHNFAASENDRASVMDYPHPKLRLANGTVRLDQAYAEGMGAWDLHTIAYGYQDFESAQAEQDGLANIIDSARNQGLRYKSDADTRSAMHGASDGHLWDNGADPVEEFTHLSKVRALALENLGLNSIPTGASLSSLENVLVPIYLMHRYQLDALAKQVGGVNYGYELKGDRETPLGVTPVTGKKQWQSVQALLLSTEPDYLALSDALVGLIPPNNYGNDITREEFRGRTGRVFDPITAAESAAAYSFSLLLAPEKLNRLSYQYSRNKKIPSPLQVLDLILSRHFYKANDNQSPLATRLQLVAIQSVMTTITDPELAPEVKARLEAELQEFTEWLEDNDNLAINKTLANYFEIYWHKGQWLGDFTAKPLPPGSPI